MDFSSEFTKNLLNSSSSRKVYEQKVAGKVVQIDNPTPASKPKKSKFNINRVRGHAINVPCNETMIKLNALWNEYTQSMNQSAQFVKMDLHGSLLTITRAAVPSNVGISGYCLRESQHMFYLVVAGILKMIPKQGTVFSLVVANCKYSD